MELENRDRPPYLWALALFVVIMVIYAITLSPTTAFWDTSEYIAAAKVLGIPHPPGNPLFTVLAHVWGLLPLAGNYAKRINYFAAATSAGGAAFWFLVAERWLRNILPARGPRIAAAFAGIFATSVAWTVWNQSTVNEKVYTVSMFSVALIVWCMVRWADMPESPRRDGMLVLAAYLTALTSTNHMMGVLALPAIGLYILFVQPRLLLKPWVLLTGWVLVFGVSGILGDALTVIVNHGTWSNPELALSYPNAIEGASAMNALVRVVGLLGIVVIAGWGVA
ncbi:MAG: glycosyltransferase family 117 protein, partial [Gemmatimonadales bacterium]